MLTTAAAAAIKSSTTVAVAPPSVSISPLLTEPVPARSKMAVGRAGSLSVNAQPGVSLSLSLSSVRVVALE
jgi:hypothetical protein